MQGYWSDFKAPDFATLPDDLIAVLPLGATEQHGPHLPLSVDSRLTRAVIQAMWLHLDPDCHVAVLPPLEITKSDEHAGFAGTLTLSATTLLAVLSDITASLDRAGVRRLLFLNGHGGNTALLEIATREARRGHGMIAAHASWFALADLGDFDPQALAHDIHAGDTETSAMLYAAADLVDMTRAEDFRTAMQDWADHGHRTGLSGQPARPGWVIEDLNPQGACGNAAAATVSKGKKLIESAGAGLALWLADFARFELDGRNR